MMYGKSALTGIFNLIQGFIRTFKHFTIFTIRGVVSPVLRMLKSVCSPELTAANKPHLQIDNIILSLGSQYFDSSIIVIISII